MNTALFVNLPVQDISRTNHFFSTLGFQFNPQFSNEQATCMIINDGAYCMLLEKSFFKSFIHTDISDPFHVTEVLNAISRASRDEVDSFVDKAISLGAKESRDAQDMGFMYSRAFHDLDGHVWEVFWMQQQA